MLSSCQHWFLLEHYFHKDHHFYFSLHNKHTLYYLDHTIIIMFGSRAPIEGLQYGSKLFAKDNIIITDPDSYLLCVAEAPKIILLSNS